MAVAEMHVINTANNCPELALNEGGAEFPSHREQHQIAAEFLQMSSALFMLPYFGWYARVDKPAYQTGLLVLGCWHW
jgi:hypothetical protein